jgi:hypothetical protein
MTLLRNPVWPACPPVCSMAWLPAFADRAAAEAWHAANGPRCQVVQVYLCPSCSRWHMQTLAPLVVGDTWGGGGSRRKDT